MLYLYTECILQKISEVEKEQGVEEVVQVQGGGGANDSKGSGGDAVRGGGGGGGGG